MNKVVVRTGLPGKVIIEVEGGSSLELDHAMGQLDTLHTLKPWIESLLPVVEDAPPVVIEVVPPPPADDVAPESEAPKSKGKATKVAE